MSADRDQQVESAEQVEGKSESLLVSLIKIVLIVVIIFGLSWLLREFVFQAYEIPSGSMEETIMTGDMVFAEKVSYNFCDVQVGDIVTFTDPNDDSRTLIKRVIAVGGQTVDINDEDGLVYVDGVALEEDYVIGLTYTLSNSDITFPYTVPEGYIWVMGDNRENSQDSRYFGAVPLSSVEAHAVLIYWPLSDFGLLVD